MLSGGSVKTAIKCSKNSFVRRLVGGTVDGSGTTFVEDVVEDAMALVITIPAIELSTQIGDLEISLLY